MLTISFLVLLALGQLAIGIVIFVESRRTKRYDQKIFAALSFLFVVWTLAVGFLSDLDAAANLTNIEQYRAINQLAFVSTFLILLLLLLFTQYYPNKRAASKTTTFLYGFGALLICLAPTPFIAGTLSILEGKAVYDYGKGMFIIAGYTLTVLIVILAHGRQRLKQASDQKSRHQISVLLFGIVSTVIHILVFVVALPAILGQLPILYAVGYAGPYYLTLFTAYGLLELGLFDIRRIVARTIGYVITILVLSGIYGFFVFGLVGIIFNPGLSLTAQIFLSLMTGIASLSFSRVKKFFDRKTNHIFYQDAYDSEELFDEYNKALVSTIELDALLKRTSHVIAKHLKSDFCLISIQDGSKAGYRVTGTGASAIGPRDVIAINEAIAPIRRVIILVDDIPAEQVTLRVMLRKYDTAMLVRLTTGLHKNQESAGYIILGLKKSGNPYSSQDFKVIETLANELIIALQNALRFEEIERFSETLQQKIEVATKKLRESNHKLKVINDQKDDFIGITSHQLRTPLTAVKGYVSLVLDEDAGRINVKQRKLLEQAFASSQRMVYLIADLLNVSRLKTGKFVIERTPSNLCKVINDEMAQLRTSASGHNLELTFDAPADFPTLMLDETKTRQVIMNFLDNAIYYTPNGGHIRVELVDLPKSIEFRVVDDGIGVPKNELHHLFTKFYRAKNAQRSRPDGTGLGLYMAQKVVVAQGGAIIFNSKEGKGSIFGFSFPKDMVDHDTGKITALVS